MNICKEYPFNEENQELAKELIEELRRLTGDDTPDDIDELDLSEDETRSFIIQEVKKYLSEVK